MISFFAPFFLSLSLCTAASSVGHLAYWDRLLIEQQNPIRRRARKAFALLLAVEWTVAVASLTLLLERTL